MTTRRTGLREEKKRATRVALREAALRLALEHGPADVRVDDIAEAAGVSPRTYNNYFSSREQAIVAAVTAERESRIAAAVSARPAHVRLADALADAILEQYTEPRDHDELLLISASPALRDAFLDAAAAIEHPLATAIDQRLGHPDPPAPASSRPVWPPRSGSRSSSGSGLRPRPSRAAGSSYRRAHCRTCSAPRSPHSNPRSTPPRNRRGSARAAESVPCGAQRAPLSGHAAAPLAGKPASPGTTRLHPASPDGGVHSSGPSASRIRSRPKANSSA